MDFVTNEKLTIVGAAGMIGSNMAQTALMMRLTPTFASTIPSGRRSRVLPRSSTTAPSRV